MKSVAGKLKLPNHKLTFCRYDNFSYLIKKISESGSKRETNKDKFLQVAERMANAVLDQSLKREHLEILNKKINLETSLDDLVNEFKSEIAKSLKKSADQLESRIEYLNLLNREFTKGQYKSKAEFITIYNELVRITQKAKQEFKIQRYHAGFTIRNDEIVDKFYVIPGLLI